jgi:O-acetylhomoserine (thiol)-lyase
VSPFNAFLIGQGLETLSLRMERHVANARAVAEWLELHDDVESVAYAGLPSSPWYERGRRYGPAGTGAIVSFDIVGGIEAGKRFVDGLELHSHVANVGDVRSLVIHPASTTHSQLGAEAQLTAACGRAWCPIGRAGESAGHPRGPRCRIPGSQGRLAAL